MDIFMSLTILVTLIVILRIMTVVAYRRRNHAQDSYAETRRWDRDLSLIHI